ncbi:MAG: glycosyltransferase [Phycisphaerae bacterium]|nr:glycosyltransferase [Phycisphaerae bacterium]
MEIGGTPTVVRELAIRLPADVVCLAPDGPVSEQIRAAGRSAFSLHACSAADLPLAVWRLIRLIRKRKYDTIFSFLIHANTVAALASVFCRGVRFIQSIQTTQPDPHWHWKLQSIVQHAANTVVVPSPSAARAATEWSNIPSSKIQIIPNAVASISFTQFGNGETVGFIGRLDPIKHVADLIEAAALLPDFRFLIFGEGSDRNHLQHTIAKLHLGHRVVLQGVISRPEDALQQIDLLVLPSAAEGFGLVLIEAMVAGIPVVATDVPGIRDVVVNGQTGVLVPPADPSALAGAIRRVLEDRELRDRLVINGRRTVQERFTWDRVLPMYRRLLAGQSA